MGDILNDDFLDELRNAKPEGLAPVHIPLSDIGFYSQIWLIPEVKERALSGGLVTVMPLRSGCLYKVSYRDGHFKVLHESNRTPGEYLVQFYYRPKGSKDAPVRENKRYTAFDLPLEVRTNRVKATLNPGISKVEAEFLEWLGKIKNENYTPGGQRKRGFRMASVEYETNIRVAEPHITEKECKQTKNYLDNAREYFGNASLDRMTRRTVRDFLANLVNKCKLKPATANRYLNRLSRFFEWAVEKEYVLTNPCQRVRFSAKHLGRRKLVLTGDEVKDLFHAADPTMRMFLTLLTANGLRATAALTLKFGQFDFSRKTLALSREQSKNKQECEVSLSSRVARVVEEWKKRHPTWSFLFGEKRPQWNPRRHWNDLQDTLPWMKTKKVTPHTLRHTFATSLQMAGAPVETIQRYMTHLDSRSTALYLHGEFTANDRGFLETVTEKMLPQFSLDETKPHK